MLSRLDLKMDRLPVEGEEVLVTTWPSGLDRLFAQRSFVVSDADGTRLGGALYSYLVVDFATRRPLRPERVIPADLKVDAPEPCEGLGGGAGEPGPGTLAALSPAFSERASPRHIDHNGHVNSAHLADWLCDAPPREARGNGALRRLKVDFMNELLLGEIAESLWAPVGEGGAYCLLRRGGDTIARALAHWS